MVVVRGLGVAIFDQLVEELVDGVFFSSLWFLFLGLLYFLVIALDERCSLEKFGTLEHTASKFQCQRWNCILVCTCVITGSVSNSFKQLLPITWRNTVFKVYLGTGDLPDAENKSCKLSEFVADVIVIVIDDIFFIGRTSFAFIYIYIYIYIYIHTSLVFVFVGRRSFPVVAGALFLALPMALFSFPFGLSEHEL